MSPRSASSHAEGPTRFRTILLVTAALALTAAGTVGSLSGRAPDGVMFRGGPEHTGVYPDARPLSSYGGMLWRVQTDGPVRSTPAVGQGMVFVGSGDFHLYALDEESGRVLWRYRADAGVTGSPAVSEGVVYVTDQASTVYAVDVETGQLVWRVPTGLDRPLPWGHESGDIWASSPTLFDDVLYVGSGDGHLYALDRATGRTRWRFATEGRVRSTPAVAEGRVYVGSGDGRIYALEASSGDLLWRADTEGASLFSGDFGFDRRTVQSSPAVADGRVFVGARDGFLYALDAASGRQLWRVDHEVSWVNGSPAVARGLVVVGSSDGRFVHAVDAVTGEERWRVGTHDIVWGSPAIVGDQVLFTDGDGAIRGVALETGEDRWSAHLPSLAHGSAVPGDGVVYVGAGDGGVYALKDGGNQRLARAVYWDSTRVRASWTRHEAAVRWLAHRGYDVVDGSSLMTWLEERAADGTASALVFAMDGPDPNALEGGRDAPLRRYLEAGGTVVWPGYPPLMWPPDPATGEAGGLDRVHWDAPEILLGVPHGEANFDPEGAIPTEAGAALGLPPRWTSRWNPPASAVEVLGLTEGGEAASWRRGYGGPPGTGFVRIWGDRLPMSDPTPLLVAAELRPGGQLLRGATTGSAPERVVGSEARATRSRRPGPPSNPRADTAAAPVRSGC